MTGTFRCLDTRCRVDAATTSGVATSSRNEALTLSGPSTGTLTGHLGVNGTAYLYKLTAKTNG